jgi:hypothetical protein
VKERRGKYGSPLFSYFPFSPFISSFGLILNGFRHEESKQQGKTFFFKYKECDLETQIATATKQDT